MTLKEGLDHVPGRIEAAEIRERAWRRAFFMTMIFLAVAILYGWWSQAQVKETLHVTAVDPDGRVLWTAAAGQYTIEEIWIETTIQDWIEKVRRREDDPVHQQEQRNKAQRMADGHCQKDIKQYFTVQDERDSTGGNRMRVQLKNFVREKQGKHAYKFWWVEKWTPQVGQAYPDLKVTGTFTAEVRTSKGLLGPVLKAGDLRRSPTGIFITECFFSTQESTS